MFCLQAIRGCLGSNELGYDYATIRAILNHTDHSSTDHYYFKSFNSLVKPIQHYANWLCGLRHDPVERQLLSPETDIRNGWNYSKPHPMDAWELPEGEALPPQAVTAPEPASPQMVGPPTLVGREREVLASFAHSRSSTVIGVRLGISYKTVQAHRARLLKKLTLKNTFQQSRYAIEHTADRLLPVPAPSRPVITPAVVPMMPAPMPIVYRSHSYEREDDWDRETRKVDESG